MDDELIINLANGCTLRCGPSEDETMYGGYVRICDAQGNEIVYWDQQEWADEPELVMGAIFGAGTCPLDKLLIHRRLEDGVWVGLPHGRRLEYDEIIEINRQRDVWLCSEKDNNCYFIPKGWVDDFAHHAAADEPLELYGYYPTHNQPNSPVDTGWLSRDVATWDTVVEVTEAEAREKHPQLGEYLDKINKDT